MGYGNLPVRIPDVPGKITFRNGSDSTYVSYETGRDYHADRGNTTPQRVIIGQQIRTAPGFMLPNENYEKYFAEEAKNMTNPEADIADLYASVRSEFRMLQILFDQLFYEFQTQSHRNPAEIVNKYKVEMINNVLDPFLKLMKGKPYAAFLKRIDEPQTVTREDGTETTTGLNNSDVSLMLTQYKGAITKFAAELC